MKGANNHGAERGDQAAASREQIARAAAEWVARCDAGLTEAEEAAWRSWLSADERHREAWQRFAAAWGVLDRPASRGTVDVVLQDLVRLDQRRRYVRGSLAAVCGLLLTGLGLLWWPGIRWDDTTRNLADAVVVLPERQTLADGSTVDLREGAEIAVRFTPEARRIVLHRGEAHFQVSRDAQRPFVVETPHVQVRAVGTAFSVQVASTAVDVLVTEGRVAVENLVASAVQAPPLAPVGPTDTPPLLLVEAGNKVVVATAAAALTAQAIAVTEVELKQRLAWRAPRLEFTGTPLSRAIELLNQHATAVRGPHFVIGDPALATMAISGIFQADSADVFVALLEGGFGIRAEHRGETEIVLYKAERVY